MHLHSLSPPVSGRLWLRPQLVQTRAHAKPEPANVSMCVRLCC
ncbi:hypothetical protein LC55x_0663 [Lysobacter capsici]|nr:hypothetical protein LC55x_0663 [Lysobacter capsici]